jgi:hypothetical protein
MFDNVASICPAPGWYAVYRLADGGEEFVALACWAVIRVEDQGQSWTEIVGVDAWDGCCSAEEMRNFIRYEYAPLRHHGEGSCK